jgi:hypothetical protein
VNIDQILVYDPVKDRTLSLVHRFFNVMLKFAVAVGIWIGLVSYFKRTEQQNWITKML